PAAALVTRSRKRPTSNVIASSMSWSRPPGNQRYTVARDTAASRATSSTVIRAMPTRPAATTVASSTRSRADTEASSGVSGTRGLRAFVIVSIVVAVGHLVALSGAAMQDQRVAGDGDGREREPLHCVAEVRALVEGRLGNDARLGPRLRWILGLQPDVRGRDRIRQLLCHTLDVDARHRREPALCGVGRSEQSPG